MRPKRLLWQIFFLNLLIVAVSLVAISWIANLTNQNIAITFLVAGPILVLLCGGVSVYLAKKIVRPINALRSDTERFAQGDFRPQAVNHGYEETSALADSINSMGIQLGRQLQSMHNQGLQQEAIVSGMLEGVLVLDSDHRLLSLNNAAAKLLNLNANDALGRSMLEVIRNSDLQRMISKTFVLNEPVEGDITITDNSGNERFLQAHGTKMRDSTGEGVGALIVLNDVTRLRKLENLRRDFVANVSHELKTPITSIKGFVETLMENSSMSTEERDRFLNIISRQANRLHAIIEDLLKLSRIEQESERGEIALEMEKLAPVLRDAVTSCELAASSKNVEIVLRCDENIRARINAPLLEQAVVNLIENAIKYSDPKTQVQVSVTTSDKLIQISVEDQGSGIAPEHLPRLFERFYTVDKARSRAQGGTGLGLAIAKHIVLSHGGTIGVESEVGSGSVFTISLVRN